MDRHPLYEELARRERHRSCLRCNAFDERRDIPWCAEGHLQQTGIGYLALALYGSELARFLRVFAGDCIDYEQFRREASVCRSHPNLGANRPLPLAKMHRRAHHEGGTAGQCLKINP